MNVYVCVRKRVYSFMYLEAHREYPLRRQGGHGRGHRHVPRRHHVRHQPRAFLHVAPLDGEVQLQRHVLVHFAGQPVVVESLEQAGDGVDQESDDGHVAGGGLAQAFVLAFDGVFLAVVAVRDVHLAMRIEGKGGEVSE
jgi:hypothetical protein